MSNRRKLRGKDWAPLVRHLNALPEDELRAAADRHPGFGDQFTAAAADSRRLYAQFCRRVAADDPDRYSEAAPRDVPPQILDQIAGLYYRVIAELAAGKRRHCAHITLGAPRPAVACIYDDWICCHPCVPRYARRPRLSEREEHTCDLCGTYRPGQTMDSLHTGVGPVMLIMGICRPCKERMGGRPWPGT